MKKYSVVGQNVYVEVNQESIKLLCIATTVDNAIEIAATLNVWEKKVNGKEEEKQNY